MARFEDHRSHFRSVIEAVIAAADPGAAVKRHWPRVLGGRRLHVLAFGKAAAAMAKAAAEAAQHHAAIARGLVIGPEELVAPVGGVLGQPWRCLPADHPRPSDRNVVAAQEAESFARAVPAGDVFLLLISGGGSAHLTLPADGLTLDEVAGSAAALMRAGATIAELNTVRKHCERLKGGRLAALCPHADRLALVVSDVVGDRLDVIASGPAAPDPTTYGDALRVLRDRGVEDAVPGIVAHLQRGVRGEIEETIKPDDPRLDGVEHVIIASHRSAVDASVAAIEEAGIDATEVRYNVEGEAAEVGRSFGATLSFYASRPDPRPRAVVWGGETTVTVDSRRGSLSAAIGPSSTGTGGPSQELALSAAARISGLERIALMTFSTDGRDGPTDAAGAIVTGSTWGDAETRGLHPSGALAEHDSHRVLAGAGALINTGLTGTNVNHVVIGVLY